ncbi:MAG: ABC transporter substrate-binding protein [Planctomycetota bacterium]
MIALLRRVGVGMLLIASASVVLLMSDPRRHREADRVPEVLILNYVSVPVLEDGEKGLVAGLADGGFEEGTNLAIIRQNAEGDRGTAILMAKEAVGADHDLILTLSTPLLQAVAGANQETRQTHVFTLSTDPWGAGVGISREDPAQHPPYMTGYGTLQPVESLFEMARQANPELRRVGVIWNPAEANSEASTLAARKACARLSIELIEVTVDSSSAVSEAAHALVNRDVQAIWAGGDSTVAAARQTLIEIATQAGIPVFTNMPSDVKDGALFALGADYFEVGRASGQLAARVLGGESPASIPVENLVPEQLAVNLLALEPLNETWTLPNEWREQASLVVDKDGVRAPTRTVAPPTANRATDRELEIGIVYYAPGTVLDSAIEGVKQRLAEHGFTEGHNVRYTMRHAQAEMTLIPAIMQELDQSDAELIIALTTPCLSVASQMVKQKPVVFTVVYDPIAAGAGVSRDQHLPNITGVSSFPPIESMVDVMQAMLPDLKCVGAVYNDSEANSEKAVDAARAVLEQRNLELKTATVSSTSDILPASQALVQQGAEVLWEIGDHTVNQGLEAMIKAGLDAGIPAINSDGAMATRGTVAGVGIRFYDSGLAAGDVAARILNGTSPAEIPFEEIAVEQIGINLDVAQQLDLQLPDALLSRAQLFHGVQSRFGRPARVAFVQLADGVALEAAARGVQQGLVESGLVLNEDIEIKHYHAQGQLVQLPQIFDAIQLDEPDLVITSTTPAMMAAVNAIPDIPVVFTVASDPVAVGAVQPGQLPKNLAGVFDDPPIDALIELATDRESTLQTVGTIWNPAEPNSEISVKRLRVACAERGLRLIERQASSISELREAALAVCHSGIDVMVISADNLTSSGFPAIIAVTQPEGIPIYCTEPDLVDKGAEVAMGVDYEDWGRQSARLVARILAGESISSVGMQKVDSVRTVIRDAVPRAEPASS